jgi:hypothetical protein
VILITSPFKIIQAPSETIFIYEPDNTHRQVLTDGRCLPRDPQPSRLGYSVGNWDGDPLVVETAGLNDKVLLDGLGHPRSESTRMIERYRRRDFGHMEVEITADDPVNYTRPFTIRVNLRLIPDSDVLKSSVTKTNRTFVTWLGSAGDLVAGPVLRGSSTSTRDIFVHCVERL